MKVVLVFLLLLGLAGGGYFFIQQSQLGQAPLGALVSSETQALIKHTRSFMEDLRYKDFKSAAKYSLPEQQGKYNIPALIERLFQIKPEFMDIQNYEVTSTDFDSSGQRARVHLKSEIKVLNTNELRKPEVILYFKKQADAWYMDLASSIK
ncbi:MAG: hypothetical protein CVV27_00975 [Candidatus Melainabacteria bacterium HGW-Melainabacteria-1]|nr:MAG: hypothetical protein CVV27_00975 [Candidatus Melainabacteria bacterium HGW-Melainabacteria-1]